MFWQIIAKETSTPEQRHNSSHVTIYIEDMNDNWPEFTESSYTASIQENPLNRTMVIQVTVSHFKRHYFLCMDFLKFV